MKKKTVRLLAAALCFLFLLSACGSQAAAPEVPAQQEAEVVYDATGLYPLSASGEAVLGANLPRPDYATDDNARVFYEIFTGSFSDSDGDGTGDLRGIIDRFDYLNDGDPFSGLSLGVEGLWLTPIFLSPSYHKYDVTDYYQIDPVFGTEEDLRELIGLCEERNVKLILDLPINHTGDRNAWFRQFRTAHQAGNTDDPYYDWYSWAPADSVPAGRTFEPIPGSGDFYECNFTGSMPELNYESEAVRQELLNVALYYLDMGVDGFRFDAAPYVYYGDHEVSTEFWNWYAGELRKAEPEIYLVGEVWNSAAVTLRYNSAFTCFDFTASQLSGIIAETAKYGDANRFTAYVDKYDASVHAAGEYALPALFISNHDMDRAAGFLTVASGQMAMAANLYLLTPGSPFIYYGEEIGMKGSRGGANTDADRRLAMLWGDGDTVSDPEGATYASSAEASATVAAQLADGGSLLSRYKTLLMVRKSNPEIARGDYTALTFPGVKLGGAVSEWNGSRVCVLHNTTHNEITVDLSEATDLTFDTIRAVIGDGGAVLNGTMLTLGSQTSVVLK